SFMNSFTLRSKGIWLILPFLLFAVSVSAQSITVNGTVTSKADGAVLPGVSIKEKGAAAAAATDENGKYQLRVSGPEAVLLFAYSGYRSLEIPVNGRNTINAFLEEEARSLNEVVVVGYGTTRKKDLTGSVTVLSADDFQQGNITTPEQLIAGKAAGVSIISNGGAPGSGSTIRIRGGSSLSASNSPLIVIDGVPLDNSSVSGASNPLSFINPNDIESFTILKDASATAIYGARAANGVVIITTKKGKSGELKVNFNSLNSLASVTEYADVLNADQIRGIVNEFGTADQKAMLGTANTEIGRA